MPTTTPSVPADANALRASELENLLVAILLGPARANETCAATFQRKESDFTAVCSRLSIVEAHALHRRLANPRAGDQLATLFSRFVVDRRARILAYIAGARKRAALAGR